MHDAEIVDEKIERRERFLREQKKLARKSALMEKRKRRKYGEDSNDDKD